MSGQSRVLFRESFTKWFRTKGFLMILAVGLIPPALTAAWVGTHDADLAVTEVSWMPESPTAGDNVTFDVVVENTRDRSVGPFNVTLRVGFYRQSGDTIRWNDLHNETVEVDGLDAGASTTVQTTWEADAGTFQVEALVDVFEGDVAEIEELNNYRPSQIQVHYQQVRPDIQRPDTGGGDNATDNATLPDAQLSLSELSWRPAEVYDRENVTFTVSVSNEGPEDAGEATVRFQVFQISEQGFVVRSLTDESQTVTLEADATEELTFDVTEVPQGLYAAAAFLDSSGAAREDNETDNVVLQQFDVRRKLVWDEPEPGATAKAFYRQEVLLPLHFTLLVPLIALFFAGGVLQDDRNRGNLVYILSRPVPRWSLPLTRFASGLIVALIAVVAGVVLTWLLLKGTPQTTAGFLWWPLVFAVLVLLLYSAVFTWVGVVSDRPYLVGLLYVLGFESLILAGRRLLVNGQPLVQDWLLNLSLMHWVSEAFAGWDPNAPGWLPQGEESITAFIVIAGIIVVSLLGAVWSSTRRQYPE